MAKNVLNLPFNRGPLYVLVREILTLSRGFRNLLFACVPGTHFSDRCLRPWLARLWGMKCGRGVMLRRCVFEGSLRNISLGDGVYIQRGVFLEAAGRIEMAAGSGLGYNTTVITGTHDVGAGGRRWGEVFTRDVKIEEGVWVASNVFIGPGVTIGRGCIVAAGAVVVRSMPPDCLVAGVPAKVIKQLDGVEVQEATSDKSGAAEARAGGASDPADLAG